MKRTLIVGLGVALLLTEPLAARPKHKHKHVPPGHLNRAEKHELLRYGDSHRRRQVRPPWRVHRHWDRDRVHHWNHHRYRWSDGIWIVVDF